MRAWMCVLGVFLAIALAAPGRTDTELRQQPHPWLSLTGSQGPGKGKLIVLIAADEEYRSEETMPQFARILAKRHGFNCVVLFGIDPKDGTICPNVTNNIPVWRF